MKTSFRSDYEGWKRVTTLESFIILSISVLEVTMRDGNLTVGK